MVLFESPHPNIEIPTDITTWEWLFESDKFSPLHNGTTKALGAYIDASTRETIDWASVKSQSTALSTAMIEHYGLGPGDTVSIFSTNTIWYPVALFATIRLGGRANGASPAYTTDEIAYALRVAQSKLLITTPSSLEVALAAVDKIGMSRDRVLLIEGQSSGVTSIQALIEKGRRLPQRPAYRIPKGLTNRAVCGYLNFSSGTTGLPKAVMLSHHNVIAQCHQLRQLQADPGTYKILAVMPLFHITGLVRFCHYPIFMNGDSIMLRSFTMEGMLKAIVDFQVQELILVPPILLRLARDPIVEQFNLRHVKRWSSGSAPISSEVLKSLQQRFPWTGFRQGYGATESTACISAHPPTHFDYKYATTGGKLVANTQAKVIDLATGSELGPNQTGEIWAKGPQIAMGYLGNLEATRETFDSQGFFHTGDVGRIDNEGLLHIEDRLKEMIKVKGLQVPPAELEDLLLGHPDVADSAVIGIPDEYAGEKPKGFVVLKPGILADEQMGHKLFAFVKQNKVRYKWLAEIEFVQQIPKSSTGKLLRRTLKVESLNGRMQGINVKDDRPRARL